MYKIILCIALVVTSFPAFAAINVTEPLNGDTVPTTLTLAASSTMCGGNPTTALGYSFDDSNDTAIINKPQMNNTIFGPVGNHILHVKCWGTNGSWDVSDLNLNIVSASQVSSVQALPNWKANHDEGSGGTSSGTTYLVNSPSLSGKARRFDATFSNSGGELFFVSFLDDLTATHFIYDAQVLMINSNATANVELDLNQVTSDGNTVLYGFQCDGYSGTWDYTENNGTSASPIDKWVNSDVRCPLPKTWTPNVWHHVQIAYSRDESGNITYRYVALDGRETTINLTVPSSFSLGWDKVLLVNFQLDGLANGSSSVVVDNLTIYKW